MKANQVGNSFPWNVVHPPISIGSLKQIFVVLSTENSLQMPVDFTILLKSLQRKKLEYETALDAINQTFEDLGLGVSTIVGHGQGGIVEKAQIQRSGIRINGELSFRGKDKAEEYFRLLDRDNDKFLSYEDIRGKHFCSAFLRWTIMTFS